MQAHRHVGGRQDGGSAVRVLTGTYSDSRTAYVQTATTINDTICLRWRAYNTRKRGSCSELQFEGRPMARQDSNAPAYKFNTPATFRIGKIQLSRFLPRNGYSGWRWLASSSMQYASLRFQLCCFVSNGHLPLFLSYFTVQACTKMLSSCLVVPCRVKTWHHH